MLERPDTIIIQLISGVDYGVERRVDNPCHCRFKEQNYQSQLRMDQMGKISDGYAMYWFKP